MKTTMPLTAQGREQIHRRGSALMLVLWALLLLTMAIFTWAHWLQEGMIAHGFASAGLEARAMSHSGVAVALHPLVTKATGLLEESFLSDVGYRVRIISEGGKLNISWLLAGEDPQKIAMLKQWLELRGLNFEQREHFVDCLLDYVEPGDTKHINGVKDDGDYHAARRPFLSVDEVAAVPGSEPLVSTPGWKNELTIDSSGPIDVLAAPAEILRLIPGFSEPRIQRLLQLRAGPDGIDGTADDPEFQSLQQVLLSLGMSQAEMGMAGNLVSINDPVSRIISEGRSGKVVRQLEVVARKGGANPVIISWKE